MQVYKKGDRGTVVAWYQKWLYKRGFYRHLSWWKHRSTPWRVKKYIVDGIYGDDMVEAVKSFQTVARIQRDGKIGSQTRSAMNNYGNKASRAIRKAVERLNGYRTKKKWKRIVFHYTVTSDGKTLQPYVLSRMHKARGWRKGGYHGLIQPDGTLHTGDSFPNHLRKSNEIGAHTRGYNSTSIGFAWVGRTNPTLAQMETMTALKERLLEDGNGWGGVYGHRDLRPTQCPGGLMVKAHL